MLEEEEEEEKKKKKKLKIKENLCAFFKSWLGPLIDKYISWHRQGSIIA